jgi:tight adherence protein C
VSPAVLVAALAGALTVVAVFELAATAARTARRTRRRRGGVGAALAVVARAGRRAGVPAAPGDLAARLDAAGRPLGLDVADVMAVKCAGALAAALAALPGSAAAPGRLGPLVLVVAPVAGFLAPDLLLARRARARAAAMTLELADVLDLVRVAVAAGLPPTRALAEVGRRHGGLLARELRRGAHAVALGVPRRTALAGLAARAPLPAVAALVAAVDRAERHGAPLDAALVSLAAEARAARARAVRDRAARAAPKIQLVVALLLVPAVLLLVAAALTTALR